MQCRWLVLILFSALALAQSSAPPQPAHAGAEATKGKVALSPPAQPDVPPDVPVITVIGLCDKAARTKAEEVAPSKPATPANSKNPAGDAAATPPPVPDPGCKTVVTREQLGNILNVLNPDATLGNQRLFAQELPELMLFAHTATEMGLDKDPRLRDFLNYKYAQALQQLILVHTQRKMSEMSDADVEKYYKEHPERFEKFALERILVPRRDIDSVLENFRPGQEAPTTEDPEMQKMAEKIQREAAAGGDFEKLEAKAYKAAHSKQEPPDVSLSDQWTIDNLPKDLIDVIPHLHVGQVSQPLRKPLGWQIFKLTSKRMVPLSEARPFLANLRMKDWREELMNSIHSQLNDEYFGGPGGTHPNDAAETESKPEGSK